MCYCYIVRVVYSAVDNSNCKLGIVRYKLYVYAVLFSMLNSNDKSNVNSKNRADESENRVITHLESDIYFIYFYRKLGVKPTKRTRSRTGTSTAAPCG